MLIAPPSGSMKLGVKVILTVRDPPGLTGDAEMQLSVSAKSPTTVESRSVASNLAIGAVPLFRVLLRIVRGPSDAPLTRMCRADRPGPIGVSP